VDVKKREMQIPIEIQQQVVGLDEKMFGVAAPMGVGPWQRQQLNEGVEGAGRRGGAAGIFGQHGELGPGGI
jgi:hypothetical protein